MRLNLFNQISLRAKPSIWFALFRLYYITHFSTCQVLVSSTFIGSVEKEYSDCRTVLFGSVFYFTLCSVVLDFVIIFINQIAYKHKLIPLVLKAF